MAYKRPFLLFFYIANPFPSVSNLLLDFVVASATLGLMVPGRWERTGTALLELRGIGEQDNISTFDYNMSLFNFFLVMS